jgi:hypothetical protein
MQMPMRVPTVAALVTAGLEGGSRAHSQSANRGHFVWKSVAHWKA